MVVATACIRAVLLCVYGCVCVLWQSSLVDGFFGRQRAEAYTPTTAPKHTAHWVEQTTVMYAHRVHAGLWCVCVWPDT